MTEDAPPVAATPADRRALEALCLTNMLQSMNELVYFKDCDSNFLLVSQAQADRLAAGDVDAVIGRGDADFHDSSHARESRADELAIMASGTPIVCKVEKATYPGDGERMIETTKQALRDGAGQIIGTFGISRDVTARLALEAELARAYSQVKQLAAELATLLESTPDAIARFDADLRCVYANTAVEHLTSRSRESLLATDVDDPDQLPPDLAEMMRAVFATGEGSQFEHTVVAGTQERYFHTRLVPEHDEFGAIRTILAVSRDFTDRKRAEDALAEQAAHDPLTGLANRVLLQDRMTHAVERLANRTGMVAVMFVDLDGFKEINDAYGHIAGDALIAEVAHRLTGCSRKGDTVSRFGGDEFVLVCENLVDRGTAVRVAERIATAVAEPFLHMGSMLHVSASIGIAIARVATTPESLLAAADAAMYAAKSRAHGLGGHTVIELEP